MSPATGIGAFSFETAFLRRVSPHADDFDELGHVNNAVYLRWAQETAVAHWSLIASQSLKTKWLWVVLRHEIDYRDPVLPGDEVIARTWLGAADGPRFDRFVDIRKPGAMRPAAFVKSTWVMIDAPTRRPKRVSREIFDAFGVDDIDKPLDPRRDA
ncbi:MAG TPA: thioesterase family protein [Parvularculaceae bacterium]|nr:thioesterase family protein [Parvularculaceae bacterium]